MMFCKNCVMEIVYAYKQPITADGKLFTPACSDYWMHVIDLKLRIFPNPSPLCPILKTPTNGEPEEGVLGSSFPLTDEEVSYDLP